MYVFYEILILTNSIMFLYFFKHMAIYQAAKMGDTSLKKKNKGCRKRGVKSTAREGVEQKRPSDFDSSESVFRVKRLLEKGSNTYTRSGA
jgi:hypothetical protein